jgi:membrane-bound serine protease (ClpP class)
MAMTGTKRFTVIWLQVALMGAALLLVPIAPAPAAPADRVMVVDIDGAISVAAARLINRTIAQAEKDKAEAIVIRLDTPGGLVTSTRSIIRDIIASKVPVIVYVAPSGARAASAGTFVVYASHLAAMAPGTNLGAATPISLGGVPGLPQPKDDKKSSEPSTAEKKSINDVVALLRSLAQMRGRNAEFAEKAVRDAATLTGEEAAKQEVVEISATSIADLLSQADGRRVKIAGEERPLATRGASIVTVTPDWHTRLLAVIADPNIALVLLLIGIYGILFEFWNPGVYLPGVVGGISLLLALIALSALPVHYGALALLLLGIALMIGEAFTPGIGALGIGGVIAFVVGAFFLYDPEGADIDLSVSVPVIIGTAIATAGLSFAVLGAALKARQRPATTGAEQILSSRGTVIEWKGGRGRVRILGEVWTARADRSLKTGDSVRVVKRDGLILTVEPE